VRQGGGEPAPHGTGPTAGHAHARAVSVLFRLRGRSGGGAASGERQGS
jgi:hypothetical protein